MKSLKSLFGLRARARAAPPPDPERASAQSSPRGGGHDFFDTQVLENGVGGAGARGRARGGGGGGGGGGAGTLSPARATALLGAGRPPRRGDGMPWFDDEEDERMPALALDDGAAEERRAAQAAADAAKVASARKGGAPRAAVLAADAFADDGTLADVARKNSSFHAGAPPPQAAAGARARRPERGERGEKRVKSHASVAERVEQFGEATAESGPSQYVAAPRVVVAKDEARDVELPRDRAEGDEGAEAAPVPAEGNTVTSVQAGAGVHKPARKAAQPAAASPRGRAGVQPAPARSRSGGGAARTGGAGGTGGTGGTGGAGGYLPAPLLSIAPAERARRERRGDRDRVGENPEAFRLQTGVRQVVEAAYADVLQEEARGPGGGLRRIVELLRQNERNKLAVENIAIAISVLSENDSVSSDAFGNHGAIEALLSCVTRYDGNAGVTKRVIGALRCLVSGSRRNGRLFEAFDGTEKLGRSACSTSYQEEPTIAVDSLKTLAAVQVEGMGKDGRQAPSPVGSDSLHSAHSDAGSLPRPRQKRGSSRLDSSQSESFTNTIGFVHMAMDLHEHRMEVQVAGLQALRTLLVRVERSKMSVSMLSDMVEAISVAFQLHGEDSMEMCWHCLAVMCDVDDARDSHLMVELDLECFFGSLRRVVASTEMETRASIEESGAQLVARALQVTSHIGWRNRESQQDVVNAGAVEATLDCLRVFQARRDVLEHVCGLARSLLASPEGRELLETKQDVLIQSVLGAIMEVTRAEMQV